MPVRPDSVRLRTNLEQQDRAAGINKLDEQFVLSGDGDEPFELVDRDPWILLGMAVTFREAERSRTRRSRPAELAADGVGERGRRTAGTGRPTSR